MIMKSMSHQALEMSNPLSTAKYVHQRCLTELPSVVDMLGVKHMETLGCFKNL